MKTITMTEAEKNNIAVGTEVIATCKRNGFLEGDVLIITEQDYDYIPWAKQKYGSYEEYISVGSFEVLDTSTIAPATTAVKLLPGERPKYGVVYTVATPNMFEVGDKIGLVEDDGSSSPWFTALHGKRNCWGADKLAVALETLTYEPEQTATNYDKGLYVKTKDFEAITDEQPVEVTQDNLAFGQVYKVLDNTAAGADEGDLLVLKRNDGSDCPFFYNLSKPDGHDNQVCVWLESLVAVNVIESKQAKALGA